MSTTYWKPRNVAVAGFVVLYLGIQLFFVLRSHTVTDKKFGFWMFPESTYFRASLARELANGSVVRTRNGAWHARKVDGSRAIFLWDDFVNYYRLGNLESRRRAKGNFQTTLGYFQHALNYVATHIPADSETKKLILTVYYTRSGNPLKVVTLESIERDLPRR